MQNYHGCCRHKRNKNPAKLRATRSPRACDFPEDNNNPAQNSNIARCSGLIFRLGKMHQNIPYSPLLDSAQRDVVVMVSPPPPHGFCELNFECFDESKSPAFVFVNDSCRHRKSLDEVDAVTTCVSAAGGGGGVVCQNRWWRFESEREREREWDWERARGRERCSTMPTILYGYGMGSVQCSAVACGCFSGRKVSLRKQVIFKTSCGSVCVSDPSKAGGDSLKWELWKQQESSCQARSWNYCHAREKIVNGQKAQAWSKIQKQEHQVRLAIVSLRFWHGDFDLFSKLMWPTKYK